MKRLTPEERAKRICIGLGQNPTIDEGLCAECGLGCYDQCQCVGEEGNCDGTGHCSGENAPVATLEMLSGGLHLNNPCGGNVCATCTLHFAPV